METMNYTPDWQRHAIMGRSDGSYVITRNGYPCHVPDEGEWTALWAEVDAFAKENPDTVTQETPPPEPTLQETREQALEKLRLRKWQAKDSGIVVNGVQIDTDARGQATISGAVTNCLINPEFTTTWKTAAVNPDGTAVWVTLDKPVIMALAAALTSYTEACFAVEAAKQAELAALDSVDAVREWLETRLDEGWPDRNIHNAA